MNMSNYFDLKTVWVNELVGDTWLFLFVGLIVIWIVASKAKMPFQVTTMFSIFWVGLCMAASISTKEFTIVWALLLMGVGFIFYYGIAKLLK